MSRLNRIDAIESGSSTCVCDLGSVLGDGQGVKTSVSYSIGRQFTDQTELARHA